MKEMNLAIQVIEALRQGIPPQRGIELYPFKDTHFYKWVFHFLLRWG